MFRTAAVVLFTGVLSTGCSTASPTLRLSHDHPANPDATVAAFAPAPNELDAKSGTKPEAGPSTQDASKAAPAKEDAKSEGHDGHKH
jgi:hypothetical protein